ncbi:hypothetical protein AX17_000833 [Amanita inopinata Kibby_2008]|nr:hypothetical protein AX17_000833 [Amanita inopinata Kibby_2008]
MSSGPLTSHIALAVVLSATSLWFGYQLGSRQTSNKLEQASQNAADAGNDSDGDGDNDDADEDLAAIKAGIMEPCKLVLVVRADLGMSAGKVAAQCGHATLACYKALSRKNPKLVQHWEHTGQAKIALKANSEEQLLELEALAKSLNLGHTQVEAGSRTVLGIGPAPVQLVNQITGNLRLF